MGFFKSLFGEKPKIETQSVIDKLKQDVATPLASYLKDQIGQGIPLYTENIVAPYSSEAKSSITKYLSQDPNSYYDTNVVNPSIEYFKNNQLPLIREDFAGGLSSSGRFNKEGSALGELTYNLAKGKTDYVASTTKNQSDLATALQAGESLPLLAQYQNWLSSQSQNNPALQMALSFLNDSTSSGTNILSALNPGTNGLMQELIIAGAAVGSASVAGS